MTNQRKPDYRIHEMFLNRWSPRAFTVEPITQEELLTMLEAARWAASSYNSQPWRFIYALRDTPAWERLLNLLVLFNQSWAKESSALVFLVSKSTMRSPRSGNEVPSPTHSFDAGTASGYFALQASLMGWYVHGMVGFDADRAFEDLSVPKGHKVEAVYAVGRKADPAGLPEELRARDLPSDRRSLEELAFEGGFPQ
ncbi:nitroreductase family protein [Tunturibacter empetritectus]|uniref:Nitroreductase n=1 Tax=Tunturiibacter lichenicola TaxID=2051959 RepID=A0A7W8JBF7_9BACT|nr:nitroreductase family protein [Edaphobacter lichenicola]MBB5346222.1 nitroreductase [Edaphobacter lichenicola]